MIKQFAIFKQKEKKSPTSPDYTISIKVNDKYTTVGGCWLKDTKTGEKFFSCKLSDGYKDISGFSITQDETLAVGSDIPESKIPF